MIASAFAPVARHSIPSLGVEALHYRHACGAEHWHLANADEHRAFVVAVRTQPTDSTGLPHILEHLSLSGSRRYPVRDPFFQMLRRSLQTFMNAMTFPDLTAYPFATQVAKDFDNLLAIYLDAVFAPGLNRLDYAQEGHRLEPDGQGWARKGVVFNEMKGAMDSTDAQLEAARERLLMAGTIYRHNSGGEPADIPRLRYDDLVAFHRRSYSPANACFVTYGDSDPARLQASFAAYIPPGAEAAIAVPGISPLAGSAGEADVPVPLSQGQDALDTTAISIAWMQGDSAAIDEVLECELIDRLLLGHAGAPLRKALEGSGLGRSTGRSGYTSSYRNGMFLVELDGISEADYARFPALVESTLQAVEAQGLPATEVEAALHQLELARREISGDHYPFGLELCFRVLSPWNYGVDPLPFLDQDAAIKRLRARALEKGRLQAAINARLRGNPRRLLLRARPDLAFHTRAQSHERAQVDADIAALDEPGRARLRTEAEALAKRQATKDDPAVLPDLELADVPRDRRWAEGAEGDGLTRFVAGTNGLLHHTVAFEMPKLSEDELELLAIVPTLIGSVGVGKLAYDEQAARLNRCCGGVWAGCDIIADPEDERCVRGLFTAEIKGLADRATAFLPLLQESLAECRFDESARLRELVEQLLSRLTDGISREGHRMAARAAMRGFGGGAGYPHRTHGLGAHATLKRLSAAIAEDAAGAKDALAAFAARCERLLGRLIGGQRHLAVIGEASAQDQASALVRQSWAMPSPADASSTVPLGPTPTALAPATAYITASAVNYCALQFSAVSLAHADAAALSVAGRLLTNSVLHTRLREKGGAYGGGAYYQSATAAVGLYSFRDPRLDDTISDMRDALRWLADFDGDARALKEAVLGVIAGLDAPASPAGEARRRFSGDLKGAGPAALNTLRARVLAITPDQVRAAARRWLPADGGSLAVVTSAAAADKSALSWQREMI